MASSGGSNVSGKGAQPQEREGGAAGVRMPQPRRLAELSATSSEAAGGRGGGSAHSPTSSSSSSAAGGSRLAAASPSTAANEGEATRMIGEGGTGVDMIPFCHDDRYGHLRRQAEAARSSAVERRRSNAGLEFEENRPC